MTNQPYFDVFLAHNSQDKPFVRAIATKLKRRGLKVWLDEEQILPGQPFQDVIQQAIQNVKSAAIFIGLTGLGKWQILELRSLINRFVDADIPVIPVLLPGVERIPEDFPFLQQLNWVSFATGIDNDEALDKLESGISQQQRIHTHETEQESLELGTQSFPKNFPPAGKNLTSVPPTKAIQVFFSYAQEDEKQLIQLEKQLRLLERQGVIQTWHNRKISAGKEWQNEINTHLDTASVILLLVSTNFIDSSYCWDIEVKRAMERHDAKKSRVIPVIIDFVDWKSSPFGKLQHLPKGDKPIKGQNREKAFRSVADGIREAVKELAEN